MTKRTTSATRRNEHDGVIYSAIKYSRLLRTLIGVPLKPVANISLTELTEMSTRMYGGLVKAVVDVNRKLVVVDADMHADEEAYLLDEGSTQEDLWGINLHPDLWDTDDFIEFDSMINLRPSQDNRSRFVEDPTTQEKIRALIAEVVYE